MSTELQTPADLKLRRKLDLLLKTGRLLVESSADTARILRNMKRTAAFLGLPEQNLHIFVNYTMLMVNLSDEHHSFVKFQRCEKHGINMEAISAVSKLSWKAIIEDYTLVLLRVDCGHPGHAISHFSQSSGEQPLCQYSDRGFSVDHLGLAFLLPFDECGHRFSPTVVYGFDHALAPLDGLCPVHRARRSHHQLCQRHARRLRSGRSGSLYQYVTDGHGHGFRYRLCHRSVRNQQFRDGFEHDAAP